MPCSYVVPPFSRYRHERFLWPAIYDLSKRLPLCDISAKDPAITKTLSYAAYLRRRLTRALARHIALDKMGTYLSNLFKLTLLDCQEAYVDKGKRHANLPRLCSISPSLLYSMPESLFMPRLANLVKRDILLY